MQKEFVPYELALRMKQLGFDNVPCLAIWYNVPELDDYEFFDFSDHFSYQHYETQYYANKGFKDAVLAPTFSQAFRWFRENYGLEGVIQQADDYTWYKWKISQYNEDGKKYIADWHEYETYEESELACLRKLIEIVEEKL